MNKARLRRWIQALESGDYKQGQGALCKNVNGSFEYCCLGVLADIELDTDWELNISERFWGLPRSTRELGKVGLSQIQSNTFFIPASLWERLDLPEAQQYYSAWNDINGMSFVEIARKLRLYL
jgi:hypothetical protein